MSIKRIKFSLAPLPLMSGGSHVILPPEHLKLLNAQKGAEIGELILKGAEIGELIPRFIDVMTQTGQSLGQSGFVKIVEQWKGSENYKKGMLEVLAKRSLSPRKVVPVDEFKNERLVKSQVLKLEKDGVRVLMSYLSDLDLVPTVRSLRFYDNQRHFHYIQPPILTDSIWVDGGKDITLSDIQDYAHILDPKERFVIEHTYLSLYRLRNSEIIRAMPLNDWEPIRKIRMRALNKISAAVHGIL